MYRCSHPSTAEEAMSLLHPSRTSDTTSDQGQEVAIQISGSYHSVPMLLPPKKCTLSKMPSHIFKLKPGTGSKEASSKENPFKQALPEHVDVENEEAVLATLSGNSNEQVYSGLQLSPLSLGYLELSGDQRRPSLSPLSEGFDDTRVVPLAPFPRVNPLPSVSALDREAAPEFVNPFATPLFPPSGFGNIILVADSADPFSPSPLIPLSAITNEDTDHRAFSPTKGKTQQLKGKALIILGEEVINFPTIDMQQSRL